MNYLQYSLAVLACWAGACAQPPVKEVNPFVLEVFRPERPVESQWFFEVVETEVRMRDYFSFMDSLVARWNALLPYAIDEYLLVQNNLWIIDTLENTDYYRRLERGEFVYDQLELVVLQAGDTLWIPSPYWVDVLKKRQVNTLIDVNIPEYKLRIWINGAEVYSFPVRVGQHRSRYLEMAHCEVELETARGEGTIVRINRYPAYINPKDCEVYTSTQRDDGRRTLLPRIPFLEPELDGRRTGHLIHPTTNPVTLGKTYSNGCIGTREADAWRIYYHASLGTRVVYRYDLEVVNESGDTIRLKDIYGLERKKR